jgi:hypothetical protein
MRPGTTISLASDEERTLRQWGRAGASKHRMVEQAEVVLLARQGKSNLEIARQLRTGLPASRSGGSAFPNGGWTVYGTQTARATRPTVTGQPRNGC